jgi:hypothetical protein
MSFPQFFTPGAVIYAAHPKRHQLGARVRTLVDFLAASITAPFNAKLGQLVENAD